MTWLAIDGGPGENLHRGRGIGVFARALAMSLDEAGVDPGIAYLSCRRIGASSMRWRPRSSSARLTGVYPRVPPRLALAWQHVDTARVLPRDVRRTGARVFLATDPNAIALDRGFATVAVAYDFIPLVFPQDYLQGARASVRRAAYAASLRRFRRVAGLIAISDATRRDAVRFLGVPASRIEVVPLAVDHAIFHPGAAAGRESPTGSDPYVLYVGEADARKNVAALIDAFLRLASKDLHLVLAGGSERTRERLRAITAGHPRIHLLGSLDVLSLASLYAGAMAFVFPSLYEGFGLPVLEAMACGTPVICGPHAAIQELAAGAAIVADPSRGEAIQAAMRRVASEPMLRAELRSRGLDRAATFTWARTRDGIIDACRRLTRSADAGVDPTATGGPVR